MSAPPTPGVSSPPPRLHGLDRVRHFWQRVSEGWQIDDLWSQFAADARSSYGFYGRDVDWEEIHKLPRWRRPLHVAREFFWALLLKMSPARRVLLLVALVMLGISGFRSDVNFEIVAAILFLLLLSLELADKVTMKRDLEIAREIQTWLVPSQAPEVAGADIAFATRPQNSVAGDYYDAFYPNPEERERLMVVIADVAGKSVPAALIMATLQASLRTIAGEKAALADLVARLNRYACYIGDHHHQLLAILRIGIERIVIIAGHGILRTRGERDVRAQDFWRLRRHKPGLNLTRNLQVALHGDFVR